MTPKYFKILSIVFVTLLSACSSQVTPPLPDSTTEEDSDPVVFGAKVVEMKTTRAEGDKPVKNKRLNLLFSGQNGLETGFADFNYQGVAYSERFDTNGDRIDLIWSYVAPDEYNGDTYSFYIDNLPEEYTETDPNNISTVFLPENNPYGISEYKEDQDSNDLWWGSLKGVSKARIENIDLYHAMARISLKVYFDNSQVGDSKSPVSASITNIFRSPVSFDRLTGNFGLPELPDENPFVLVEDENGWKENLDESGMYYYTSPDFILPPQEVVSNARPRLSVVIRNDNNGEYQTFSGLLPLAMYLEDEKGVSNLWTMSFLKGYKLVLTVKISNTAADLQFLPVSILDWEPVGSKLLTGLQASIVDGKSFGELIETYNNATDDSLFYKWGYQSSTDNVWCFNIFHNLTILASDYAAKMKEKSQFQYGFKLYYSTVEVVLRDGTKVLLTGEDGERQLKDLLNTGKMPTTNSQE